MTASLHVLVLAAGESKRLGEPKQLVRVGGRPALHIVVSNAVAVAGHAVTVVIGAHARDLTQLLVHSPASVVVNRDWEEGMASSIRRGLAALPPACEAVLIALGDQVLVTADDFRRLISAWKSDSGTIAASVYQGGFGVPAIFPSWCFSDLSELRGDRGARAILQRHAPRLAHVPMPNAAFDLDTPDDLLKLRARIRQDAGHRFEDIHQTGSTDGHS
jgi:molybdenum cofactor cytidylyltransferase